MAVIEQSITEQYAIYNGDSAEVLASIPDHSVGLCVYSPPFATENGGCLYNYSSSPRDLSNSRTYAEFFDQYAYIVEHTARVLMPGRISCVHCMDVPKDGANIAGFSDFPGDIIRLHEKLGFDYTPRRVIWKEPLEVRNRTMSKALAHRTLCEDGVNTNCAAADYLIPFRRRGENPKPVVHEHGILDYAGEEPMPSELRRFRGWKGNQIENKWSHQIWRRYASSVWMDIRLQRVLPYDEARDEQDERHQHPLQLDVIERCVELYSNPGDVVLTPFMGVGSEVYGAVSNGRRGIGIELKPSYYRQAKRNLESLATKQEQREERTLFDLDAE
jgi:DNA modification methylase